MSRSKEWIGATARLECTWRRRARLRFSAAAPSTARLPSRSHAGCGRVHGASAPSQLAPVGGAGGDARVSAAQYAPRPPVQCAASTADAHPDGGMYSRVGRVPAFDATNAPLARCGHSLTACLGENARKLILFGGATALENSSTAGGAATGIRLAGATADVHCFDIRSGTWTKLAPEGEAPSPRAAHAAAAVGSMVVVQARGRAAPPAHAARAASH